MKTILVLGLHEEWLCWLDSMKASNPIYTHKIKNAQFIVEDTTYYYTSTTGGDMPVIDRLRGTEFHDVIYLHSCSDLKWSTIQYVESRIRLRNK